MKPLVGLPADVQSPKQLLKFAEAEDPATDSRVRSVLAVQAATPEPRTIELQPVAVQCCRLNPMFDLAAQCTQKRPLSRWA